MIHDQDEVGIDDRRQTVRDHKSRPRMSASIARPMASSVRVSTLDVASSRTGATSAGLLQQHARDGSAAGVGPG